MLQLDVHVAVGFPGLNLSLFPTYAVGLHRFLTICRSPAIIYSDFGQVADVRRPFSAISHNFPVIRRLFSLVSGDFQVSRVDLRRFRTVCRCPESNSDHLQYFTGERRWFTMISDSLQFLEAISSNFGCFPSASG